MRVFARLARPTIVASSMAALLALNALAAPGDTVADRVLGQPGLFSNSANNCSCSTPGASTLWQPSDAAMDNAGHLYVVDTQNSRVLEYDSPLTNQTANRVFGQGGSFTSGSQNNGGTSAGSLSLPSGVAVDLAGHVYIADTFNNRVLEYDSPLAGQTANRVFGQAGSFTTSIANNGGGGGGAGAASLYHPTGVAVDSAGRLYVADWENSRVLEFDSPLSSQTADRVFGQNASFNNRQCNLGLVSGGIQDVSLCNPWDMTLDAAGRLYIADWGNHRVLEYDSPLTSQTAGRVFGQGGSFANATCNLGGISATSLCHPGNVAVGGDGRLLVADRDNSRVLQYDAPLTSQSATRVFGHSGVFNNGACNDVGPAPTTLCNPYGMTFDSGANLYVADYGNNRVLEYDQPVVSDSVGGIAEQPDVTTPASGRASAGNSGRLYFLAGIALAVVAVTGLVSWGTRAKRRS